MSRTPEDVTALLSGISSGKEDAWNKLLAVVYRELHAMAHSAMRQERPGHTLQTTALVHEAYMRLVQGHDAGFENRAHFFSVAARAMRRILVDRARSRKAVKRGKGEKPLPLDKVDAGDGGADAPENLFEDLDALDRALDKLGAQTVHKRKCTVVELRFFVGLTHEQTADVLGVSMATVARDWEFTRAWLFREMKQTG